jgi:hypothetical protein
MSFAPKIILNWAFYLNGVILLIFTLSDTIPFWILILPFLYTFVTGMVPYKVLTISGESRVFQITLGLQPYIHKKFDSRFLFDWNYL